MLAKSIKEAWDLLPVELQTDAAMNTLDYVFLSIGHKCTLIVKHGDELFQIQLLPSKISNHYRKFLPKTLKKKSNIRLLNCVVKEFKKDDGENEFRVINLFKEYEAAGHSIPTGVYLVSPTDALIYRTNFKDPFYHVTGSMTSPIVLKHPLLPIMAWSGHKEYLDVPIPMIDDMDYVRGTEEFKLHMEEVELDFSKKKPMAVFRGTSTGCGWTTDTNPRLKAVKLSEQYPTLLDAQITAITQYTKFHKTRRAGMVNRKEFHVAKKIKFEDQSHYKYILQLDGNVAAYRLARIMLLGSTILLQESGSSLWFQHLMKPYVHYVPVKDDLNDVITQIKWCIRHEKECETIANTARTLALKVLTKESMFHELGRAITIARTIAKTNGKMEK